MAWRIEFESSAERELVGLEHDAAKRVLRFLHERVAPLLNPRFNGGSLKGPDLGGFWKFRVGDYHIVAHIYDGAVTILVVRVGHQNYLYTLIES